MTKTIPEYWLFDQPIRQQNTAPVKWRAIPWILFILFFAPSRAVPRIINTGWLKTTTVFLASTFFAVCITLRAIAINLAGRQSLLAAVKNTKDSDIVEIVQQCVAGFINMLHSLSHTQLLIAMSSLAVPLFFAVIIVTLPTGLTVLVPESLTFRRKYFLCLQVLFWGNAVLIPISIILTMLIGKLNWDYLIKLGPAGAVHGLPLLALVGAWWLNLITKIRTTDQVNSATRNQLRIKPRCTDCGYSITGLQENSNCPECGSAISKSLPEFRSEIPWTKATIPYKPQAYCRTVWQVLWEYDYFKVLPTSKNRRNALTYAITTAVISGIFLSLALGLWYDREVIIAMSSNNGGTFSISTIGWYAGIFGIACSGALLFFLTTVAVAQLASQFGRHDPQHILIITAYTSSNFMLAVFCTGTFTAIKHFLLKTGIVSYTRNATIPVGESMMFIVYGPITIAAALLWTTYKLCKMRKASPYT